MNNLRVEIDKVFSEIMIKMNEMSSNTICFQVEDSLTELLFYVG